MNNSVSKNEMLFSTYNFFLVMIYIYAGVIIALGVSSKLVSGKNEEPLIVAIFVISG